VSHHSKLKLSITHDLPQLLDYSLLLLLLGMADGEVETALDGRIPVTRIGRRDDAASLLEDDPPSSDVPTPDSTLPEDIENALGDVAEVQRGGTVGADGLAECAAFYRVRQQGVLDITTETPVRSLTLVTILDGNQARSERRHGRRYWLERKLVLGVGRRLRKKGTLVLDGGVHVASERVVNDADD